MKRRVLSALVALIILVPLIIIGGIPFKIGASVLGLIGMYELIRLKEDKKKLPIMAKVLTYISFLCLVLSSNETFLIDFKVIVFILFALLIPIIFYRDNKKYNIEQAFYLMASLIFLGISFSYLISVRLLDLKYLIFLLLITTCTDTFAYITGCLIGRNKLCPSISPNKSWEGFFGGLFFGTFISTVFYISAFNYTGNIIVLVLITMFLSIIGQFGDLLFSSIKRHYKVKDFGNIMPGHGGVLDRLDSILFVVLAFSFIMNLI